MIARLLEHARRRGAQQGDALWRRSERTTVSFEWGRLKAAGASEEAGINLRVLCRDRVGVAGSTATEGTHDELIERALASAALGERLELVFPGPTSVPDVRTFVERAASASLDALIAVGRELVDRLTRDGCQVNVTVEREVAETEVGNTAGAAGSYRATGVGVSADVWRVSGDDVLAIGDASESTDLPVAADIDRLVRSINTRLERALTLATSPEGTLPVVFTPAGLSAVLLPVTQALSGKAVVQGISPLAGKQGQQVFDPAFSLVDDPLREGRTASRPLDDEGVSSRVTTLVERGIVREFIFDLETAARAGAASTGAARRGVFSKPAAAYTNLLMTHDGAHTDGDDLGGGLLAGIADGLLVDELIGVGQGNVAGGAFSHPVALAYRVRHGELVGRVKDAAVAGNSYDLLRRVGGVGRDARWYGGRFGSSLLLDGVSVARR